MMRRALSAAALAASITSLVYGGGWLVSTSHARAAFSPARTQFVLRCGGCHGPDGVSPPQAVPVLKDTVGWFLCTPAGRDYVVRLPNVSRAQLSNEDLADVLNYVVFDLGGESAGTQAKPFSAKEIAKGRKAPLNNVPLLAFRTEVVTQMVETCDAPASLLTYGVPE